MIYNSDILFSIQPRYIKMILDGRKTLEYRNKYWKVPYPNWWLLKNSIIQAVKLIYALLRYNKSIGISCFPAFSLHFLGTYSEVIVWSIVTARFNCHLNPLVPV